LQKAKNAARGSVQTIMETSTYTCGCVEFL
jgi:hypothetical protein